MDYRINESLYIREENDGKEKLYFIYVGEEDEMYKFNEASFDVFTMIKSRQSISDICKKLQDKYCESTPKNIEEKVNELISTFMNIGIIERL